MKDKAAKYLALLVRDIFMYIFNTVFVYIGFNVFLPLVFDFVPKLSLGKIIILVFAIDFISMPIRLPIELYIKKAIYEEIKK